MAGYLSITGFFIILSLFLAYNIGLTNIIVESLDEEITDFDDSLVLSKLTSQIILLRTEMKEEVISFIITNNEDNRIEYDKANQKLDQTFENAMEIASDDDKIIFKNLFSSVKKLEVIEQTAINQIIEGNHQQAEFIIANEEYQELSDTIGEFNNIFSARKQVQSEDVFSRLIHVSDDIRQNKENLNNLANLIVSSTIVLVIAGLFIGFFLSNSISRPIKNLRDSSNAIAKGNLDVTIKIPTKDEIGELAQQFEIMRKEIKSRSLTLNERQKELEKVNEELHLSEEKYRSLYEGSPDLYRTINIEGIILDCNKSYAEKLGYIKEDIIGKSIFDHVMEEGEPALLDSFETWKKTGHVSNKEVWLKRKDGTSFPVLINASSLYDKNGKLVGSNTIIRDISELRMMKKEVAYLKQKRLALVGELASQVAHDLRNPLSVIKNAVELIKLKSEHKADEKTKTALDRVDRAVNRMSHQIEDVLDYVKVQPLKIETTNLADLIKDAVPENLSPNIKINLPNDDITLICDTRKLEAAFTNLISNAIDAVGDSGVIDVKVTDDEKHIQIEFQNSGPEIPKDNMPKIFDPLFTTKQVGTGLGLSSAKLIVEQQGGEINVRNNPTTFVITLPKKGNQKNHNNI